MAGLGHTAVSATILFLIYECCLGIRVADLDLEISDLDQQDQQGVDGEFEGLLTPWEADALVETASQHRSTDQEDQNFLPVGAKWAFRTFRKLLKQGKQQEAAMTCEEIKQNLPEVVNTAAELMEPLCTQGVCDIAALDIDLAATTQSKFIALASAADKKRCLPEAMEGVSFQQFLKIVPAMLKGGADEEPEDQSRMREAYSQMLSFQRGFKSLADGMADRKLLLSHDFLDKSCPCDSCKPLSGFSFRCYLTKENKNKAMPQGVLCSEAPTKRWGAFMMSRKYRKECTVTDWEQAALQQLHISAVMSCASLTTVLGLRSGVTPITPDLFETCVDLEQREEVSVDTKEVYEEKLKALDDVVSKQHKVVMGLVLTFGQVSGMADLRAASRGNLAPSALLQEETFSQAFAEVAEDVDLAGRDADMYGDRSLMHREQVRQRLKRSKTATVQAAGPVQQGTMPLLLLVLEARGNPKDAAGVSNYAGTTSNGGAAVGVVGAIALGIFMVFFIAFLGLQIWLSHLIAMVLLGAFAVGVAGAAKTLLYVLFFIVGWGVVNLGATLLGLLFGGTVTVEKA